MLVPPSSIPAAAAAAAAVDAIKITTTAAISPSSTNSGANITPSAIGTIHLLELPLLDHARNSPAATAKAHSSAAVPPVSPSLSADSDSQTWRGRVGSQSQPQQAQQAQPQPQHHFQVQHTPQVPPRPGPFGPLGHRWYRWQRWHRLSSAVRTGAGSGAAGASPPEAAATTSLPHPPPTQTTPPQLAASPPSRLLPPTCPSQKQPQSLQDHHHQQHQQHHHHHHQHEKRRSSRLFSTPVAMMPEYRHIRSGSLSIANGAPNTNHSMPRSPPNTSHVPCKFYRQGACQAGNACPFSHDLGAAAENICKYFAKGNCKFGPKCANIHVLPDGRRINYGKNGVTIGPNPLNLGSRSSSNHGSANPVSGSGPYNASTASALTSSLYLTDQSFPFDERQPLTSGHLLDNSLPTIDGPFSLTNSKYGSPRDEDLARLGFPLSPINGSKGLSVLDAPLPASFDSNGISNAARYPAAPWPSSVPSKFGLESLSPSVSSVKDSRTSETLKLLHTSAFGSSEHLATPTAGSPPNTHNSISDEYFRKRVMHSSRYAKPKLLSSSAPKNAVDRDWDPMFAFDDGDNVPENLVPGDLQELLTPLEKARRGSMRAEQPDISIDGITKYGNSPIGSSPSRWGSLFQRQKEDEELGRIARATAASFGHVGSPLRNSILAQEANDDFRVSNGLPRPSSIRTGSEAMSALSQQLQRNRLDDAFGSASPRLHPVTSRTSTNGMGPIGKDRAMERHVSSGSISSSMTGRFTTPIDEEDPPFVFSMEDEDSSSLASKNLKRASAGFTLGNFTSYASAVANPGGAKSGSKEGRDAVPVSGR